MLKCSRLRWVCAPQYRSAGTSTLPRLSNSCRIPVACRPIGKSRILGAWSLVFVMTRSLPTRACGPPAGRSQGGFQRLGNTHLRHDRDPCASRSSLSRRRTLCKPDDTVSNQAAAATHRPATRPPGGGFGRLPRRVSVLAVVRQLGGAELKPGAAGELGVVAFEPGRAEPGTGSAVLVLGG